MKGSRPIENIASLKSFILQLQLSLEFSQINEILSTYNEALLFLTEYSFLFENSSLETPFFKNTHTNFKTPFSSPDPARDGWNWWGYCAGNPVMCVDTTGLTTLDDFNYQKRTEDPDKSVDNQRKYDHIAREYALQNQGLTDYGNAIHNNEQFFYDFLDKKFDRYHPLNQLDLDKFLGFATTLGTTQSCLLASLYNAYASLIKGGISGSQIADTIFDIGGNFRIAPDGKPYIDKQMDEGTGKNSPFIRGEQLGNFSWSISSSLGLSQYIHIGPTDRYDSIANDISYMEKGLYGILKMENKKNLGHYHFVYVDNYERIDSLPEDRPKPVYSDQTIMLLELRRR